MAKEAGSKICSRLSCLHITLLACNSVDGKMRMLLSYIFFLFVDIWKYLSMKLKVLEEGLVNHPVVGFGESGRKTNEMRILLAKIEESEV